MTSVEPAAKKIAVMKSNLQFYSCDGVVDIIRFIKLPSVLALVIGLFHSLSYGDDFYISPDIGRGSLDIKPRFSVDGEKDDVQYTFVGLSIGYLSDLNIVAEGGISVAASDNFLAAGDDYKLYEVKLAVGYYFKLFKHLSIVPKLGYSRWELDTKEGKFLNPGEELEDEFTGDNVFRELYVEFFQTSTLKVYGAYIKSHYDFGDLESTRLGIKFSFAE